MDRLQGSPQLWRIGEGATSSPPLTTAVPIHWQDDNQFPPGDPWASAPTSGPPASPGGNRRTAAHFGFRAVRVPERCPSGIAFHRRPVEYGSVNQPTHAWSGLRQHTPFQGVGREQFGRSCPPPAHCNFADVSRFERAQRHRSCETRIRQDHSSARFTINRSGLQTPPT